MNGSARAAIAVAVVTLGSAIAQGAWNQSGPDTGAVTLVMGREGKLVSGGQRNSATSVRLWLGPEGAGSVSVTNPAWLDAVGFGLPGRLNPVRLGFVVLDAGTETDRGPEGLTVVDVGRDALALQQRYADGTRYLIAPARIRQWSTPGGIDSLGTVMLARDLLHVPSGLTVGNQVQVRTGRSGVPYVAEGRKGGGGER